MSHFHESPTPDKWSLMATAWIDPEIHRPYIGLATRDRHGGDVIELKSGELSNVLIWLEDYATISQQPSMPRTTRINEVLDLCLTADNLAYFRVWGMASKTFGPIKADEYREALMWIPCPCCGRQTKAVNLLRRWEGSHDRGGGSLAPDPGHLPGLRSVPAQAQGHPGGLHQRSPLLLQHDDARDGRTGQMRGLQAAPHQELIKGPAGEM